LSHNGNLTARREVKVGSELRELMADGAAVELRERLAELELALEDSGWVRLGVAADREFSRNSLNRIIRVCRLMYLSNPLIRRAVDVEADYVWGQGVNIRAVDPTINSVVQRWLDHPQNRVELTGPLARLKKHAEIKLAGNVFLVLFTNPTTGMVLVRSIEAEEIQNIVTNPDDVREPWYYVRSFTPLEFDPKTGAVTTGDPQTVYYPDWRYRPAHRPPKINGAAVQWDAPIYHVHVGALAGSRFGVPDIFPAIDWARAVKEDLEDYATIRKALTRFAWKFNTKAGPRGVQAARSRLDTTYGQEDASLDRNPPPIAGATWIQAEGNDLTPINKSGATLNPEEARRLWLMVSAATGIPEVMLSGDATLGSYATAKTLDRPTELKMRNRQGLWAEVLSDLIGYVVDQAALATSGPLKGQQKTDDYTGVATVVVMGPPPPDPGAEPNPRAKAVPLDRGVDIDFPEILERDMQTRVQSIATAATLNGQPLAGVLDMTTIRRLLLNALAQDDVDELLEAVAANLPESPPNEPPEPGPAPEPGTAPAPTVPSTDVEPPI
jgi:hypothetical protein